MSERGSRHENSRREIEESERTRREVVQLLRSILGEVTISAEGKGAALTPPQVQALELYALLRQRVELTPPRVTLIVEE